MNEITERPLKILHAPVNIGNAPWELSRAQRKLGLDASLVVNYPTWVKYPADEIISSKPGSRDPKEIARRYEVGAMAPFQYDVLHYWFGRSLLFWDDLPDLNKLPFEDLYWAKKLGKKVYMTLQGCDIRMAGRSNARSKFTPCGDGKCTVYRNCVENLDKDRQWLADNILPLCDHVFWFNPELGHDCPVGSFLPYMSVDIDKFDFRENTNAGRPRIVHAPSDPGIKGSYLILAALEELRSEFDFELVVVQNTPHEEAVRIYRDADIAIDQILAGWYGGLAVELMAMGKPVLCYIRDEDLHFIPQKMRYELPLLPLRPDTLKENLRYVLANRDQWQSWARRGRHYVERWHDPVKIAKAVLACYKDPENRFDLESVLTM